MKRFGGLSLVLIASFLFFLFLFGTGVLDPHQINWVIADDSEQFIYGFKFFNAEAWTHPLGKIVAYSYPESSSIVYTDSIPYLALLGKAFFHGLSFQYFGIWLAFCFLAQGAIAFLLLSEAGLPLFSSILGSFFFLSLPTFLNRTLEDTKHYSLVGQFFVLLGIFLNRSEKYRKNWMLWLGLIAATLGVHLYLTAMIAFLMGISFSWEEWKSIFKKKSFYGWILGLGILFYELGYLAVPLQNSTAGGFGSYSVNLTTLFDSYDRSLFHLSLPRTISYHEGFQYFGLGLLLLLGISIFSKTKRAELRQNFSALLNEHWIPWFALLTLCTSFQVMVFDHRLLEWATMPVMTGIYFYFRRKNGISWIRMIAELAAVFLIVFGFGRVFRASGRFFWVPEYFLLYLLLRLKPHPALLAVLLAVQISDISPLLKQIQEQQQTLISRTFSTGPDLGKDIDSFDHISVIGGYFLIPPAWLDFALDHHKTIGPLSAARGRSDFRKKEREKIENDLLTLKLDPRIMYIVGDDDLWKRIQAQCATNTDACARLKTGFFETYHYVYLGQS